MAIFQSVTVKNNIINFRFRDFSYDNINSYLSNIDAEFQLFDGYNGDANIHAENVSMFLSSLQNKYFPIKSKTMSTKRIKIPWLTSEIVKCIDKKHRWHRMVKYKIITLASYKKYCSIFLESSWNLSPLSERKVSPQSGRLIQFWTFQMIMKSSQ